LNKVGQHPSEEAEIHRVPYNHLQPFVILDFFSESIIALGRFPCYIVEVDQPNIAQSEEEKSPFLEANAVTINIFTLSSVEVTATTPEIKPVARFQNKGDKGYARIQDEHQH